MTATNPKAATASEPLVARVYVRGDLIAGKYRLRQVLGKGGMGEVWAAVNTHLDAPVAIKVIRTGTENEEARQRLIHEARATARLRHRAIVRVFDVGETELGDPFIVMERLTGESLGRLLERRRLISGEQAAQIVLPILHALAAAHRAGIVHRDVKPDNVFLEHTDSGLQPKLLDFGVVKLQQEPFAGDLTNTGTTLGSPFYMSPEQARGLVVDQRVDLWSVAVVLYEAVSGTMPFIADNYNALLRAIIENEPAPLDQDQVHPSLASIILQGLAHDCIARWQTAEDFGRALALWLAGQGIKTDITGNSIASTWLESDRITSAPATIGSIPPPASSSDEWLERAETGFDVTQPRESAIVERSLPDAEGTAKASWVRRGAALLILFLVSSVFAFWGVNAWVDEPTAGGAARGQSEQTAQLPELHRRTERGVGTEPQAAVSPAAEGVAARPVWEGTLPAEETTPPADPDVVPNTKGVARGQQHSPTPTGKEAKEVSEAKDARKVKSVKNTAGQSPPPSPKELPAPKAPKPELDLKDPF